MAKQTINLGTSANKGDGDPLRTAFDKINDNFNELYAGNNVDPANTAANLIPDVDGTRDLGSSTKRWGDLYVRDFIYLNGTRIEVDGFGNLLIAGKEPRNVTDIQGSVFADDSSLLVDAVNGKITAPVTGDLTGSVFADDSTILVDAVNGNIPGYISIATLKTEVAASADFTAFKARIAAL